MTTTTRLSRGQFWGIWGGLGGAVFGCLIGPWFVAWRAGALDDLIRVLGVSTLLISAMTLQAGAVLTLLNRFVRSGGVLCMTVLQGTIFTTCGVIALFAFEWMIPQLMANAEFKAYTGPWGSSYFPWFAAIHLIAGMSCWAFALRSMRSSADEVLSPPTVQGFPA